MDSIEMSSKTEEALVHDYNFVVVGGGIAGVTCVETVSYFVKYLIHCYAGGFVEKLFYEEIYYFVQRGCKYSLNCSLL